MILGEEVNLKLKSLSKKQLIRLILTLTLKQEELLLENKKLRSDLSLLTTTNKVPNN